MITLDYLAGFIDGEGSFCVSRYTKKNNYRFQLTITNTDLVVLKEIQKSYGGKMTSTLTPKGTKRAYTLYWQGGGAVHMANILRDKLIIKKKQAETFCNLVIMKNKGKGCRKKLSLEETEKRRNAYWIVKHANGSRRFVPSYF